MSSHTSVEVSTEESSTPNAGLNDSREHRGHKFLVNIEGTEHTWDKDTITTEEIITLGGWDPSLGAIEIDKDNNERTLQSGEVIDLKPGHGFSKKIRWKRG